MTDYELFEHTADIGFVASGRTLADAFSSAGRALIEIITGGADIGDGVTRRIEVESIDLPGLLVGFLSQVIYILEAEGLVLGHFSVVTLEETRIVVEATGETFDDNRHADGIQVKAVSYHLLEIEPESKGGPAQVKVLLDV